jgi:hypothetical protein
MKCRLAHAALGVWLTAGVTAGVGAGLAQPCCAQSSAAGQQAGTATAADAYTKATEWWTANARGDNPILTQEDLIILSDGLSGSPTPAVRAALEKVRPYLDLVRGGGLTKEYGMRLDREQGLSLLLPHLSSLRNAARVLRLDAEVRMADGDVRGAAEAMRAIVGFSSHVREDGVLVSSLVSGAMLALDDTAIDRALSLGAMDAETANELATALEEMRGTDPLRMAEAVRSEGELLRTSITKMVDGEGDESVDDLRSMLGLPMDAADESFKPEAIRGQLDAIDGLYGEAAIALANPDRAAARAAIAEIERRATSGEAGKLAQLLMPSLLKAAESGWRVEDMVAARYAILDDIRTGRKSAAAFANAAYPYLRAAEYLAGLERERQALIETARLAASALEPKAVEDTRREIARFREPLRAAFHEAAERQRCDFSISRAPRPALLMTYLPGLRAAVRVMLADAAMGPATAGAEAERGVRGSDVPSFSSEEAISAALRLARHLASDPAIGHAVVATSVLQDATAALEEAIAFKRLGPEAVARIRLLAEQLGGPDPVAITKALDAERTLITQRWSGHWATAPIDGLEAALKRRGEGLSFFLLCNQLHDSMPDGQVLVAGTAADRDAAWRRDEVMKAALLGIGDLVRAEAFEEALRQVEAWEAEPVRKVWSRRRSWRDSSRRPGPMSPIWRGCANAWRSR